MNAFANSTGMQGPERAPMHSVEDFSESFIEENEEELLKEYFKQAGRVEDLNTGMYSESMFEEELLKNQKTPGLMGLLQRFLPGGQTGRSDMYETRDSFKQFDSLGNLISEENLIDRY